MELCIILDFSNENCINMFAPITFLYNTGSPFKYTATMMMGMSHQRNYVISVDIFYILFFYNYITCRVNNRTTYIQLVYGEWLKTREKTSLFENCVQRLIRLTVPMIKKAKKPYFFTFKHTKTISIFCLLV